MSVFIKIFKGNTYEAQVPVLFLSVKVYICIRWDN